MNLQTHIAEYRATATRRRTLAIVAVNFVLFAALLVAMYYVRARHAADWPVPFEFGSLLMAFAMTMAALCASATLVVANYSAAAGKPEESVRWVAIAISSWLVFLFLETVEWVRMVFLVNLGPETPFGGTYFALVGAHWLAVVACTVWITFVIVDVRRRDILAAALYSHFLAIWWIVLVILLYLPNMNPLADL